MDIEQKQDKYAIPHSVYTLSAGETNQLVTEVQNVITQAGLTLDANDLTQLVTAILQLIANATPLATTAVAGLVKPDGVTVTTDANGVISVDSTNLANTNLSNLTDTGKVKSANLSKPTRTVKATSLAVPAANTPFTAPADGYYCLVGSQNVQIIGYDDNGNQGLFAWGLGLILPVSKGQTCRVNYGSASHVLTFGFVYATGAESEA